MSKFIVVQNLKTLRKGQTKGLEDEVISLVSRRLLSRRGSNGFQPDQAFKDGCHCDFEPWNGLSRIQRVLQAIFGPTAITPLGVDDAGTRVDGPDEFGARSVILRDLILKVRGGFRGDYLDTNQRAAIKLFDGGRRSPIRRSSK